jgi:hypothetical protein
MVINSERVPRTYGKNCVQGNQWNEPKLNAQKQIYLIISHHYLNKSSVIACITKYENTYKRPFVACSEILNLASKAPDVMGLLGCYMAKVVIFFPLSNVY